MIPRLSSAAVNIGHWIREASIVVNNALGLLEGTVTRVDALETDLGAAQADITALQGADTALDGRLDTIEAHYLPTIIKLTPLASDPASPAEGWIYSNSATHKLRYYDGTAWQDLF